MADDVPELCSLDDLRCFVQQTICDQKQLLLGAFKFEEKVLVQKGKTCGLHYIVCGPRAVQYSAIWDAARHTILFYDCNGDRFHRCDLSATARLHEELIGMAKMNEQIAA